jgi:hypothetical protein
MGSIDASRLETGGPMKRWNLVVVFISIVWLGACSTGGNSTAGSTTTGGTTTIGRSDHTTRTTPSGRSTSRPHRRSALPVIVAASTRTMQAGSSRLAIAIGASDLSGQVGDLHIQGNGAFDYATRQGQFSMAIPSIAGSPGGSVAMILDHGVLYERIPNAAQSGTPWIKIDLSSAFGGLGQTSAFGLGDPEQNVSFLAGATKALDRGTATVRGATVERYRVLLDLARAARRLSPAAHVGFQEIEAMLGGTTLPADVFVDSAGRLRRMHVRFVLNPSAFGNGSQTPTVVRFDETVDLYDFGVPVHVTPPPASEVTDVTGMIGAPGSTSG